VVVAYIVEAVGYMPAVQLQKVMARVGLLMKQRSKLSCGQWAATILTQVATATATSSANGRGLPIVPALAWHVVPKSPARQVTLSARPGQRTWQQVEQSNARFCWFGRSARKDGGSRPAT